MDKMIIPDLPLVCRIGITEQEQAARQRLVAHVELELDLGPAAQDDALTQTVDYSDVCRELVRVAEARPHKLIENLAGESCQALLDRFPLLQAVVLRLQKPLALSNFGASYAAVEIRRSRDA